MNFSWRGKQARLRERAFYRRFYRFTLNMRSHHQISISERRAGKGRIFTEIGKLVVRRNKQIDARPIKKKMQEFRRSQSYKI